MNPPLLFLLTCSLKSKFLEWISRSNSRSWLTCFLQAKEAQAKPEAILARFKGRLQICPKGLSIQYWAMEYYFTFASQKPEGHYAHLMLYIEAVTQMEDNQRCSRPTVLQKCLNNSVMCYWAWEEVVYSGSRQQESHQLLGAAVTPTATDSSCGEADLCAFSWRFWVPLKINPDCSNGVEHGGACKGSVFIFRP